MVTIYLLNLYQDIFNIDFFTFAIFSIQKTPNNSPTTSEQRMSQVIEHEVFETKQSKFGLAPQRSTPY